MTRASMSCCHLLLVAGLMTAASLLAEAEVSAPTRAVALRNQSGSLYYVTDDAHTILRYSFRTHRTAPIVTMANQPGSMVRTRHRLFWQQYREKTCAGRRGGGGEIMSISLTTPHPQPRVFLRCTYYPTGLAVLHGYLYF